MGLATYYYGPRTGTESWTRTISPTYDCVYWFNRPYSDYDPKPIFIKSKKNWRWWHDYMKFNKVDIVKEDLHEMKPCFRRLHGVSVKQSRFNKRKQYLHNLRLN